MKKAMLGLGTIGLAGAVSLGVLSIQGTAAAADDDVYVKREDQATGLALAVADDDDDDREDGDTRTRTRTRTRTGGTGNSLSRTDGTNSRFTAVSRDTDLSRGDLTKDFTRDGGSFTRDLTPNLTNDRSRNDTRG